MYLLAVSKQNSAAPIAPQAIPNLADVKQLNGAYSKINSEQDMH